MIPHMGIWQEKFHQVWRYMKALDWSLSCKDCFNSWCTFNTFFSENSALQRYLRSSSTCLFWLPQFDPVYQERSHYLLEGMLRVLTCWAVLQRVNYLLESMVIYGWNLLKNSRLSGPGYCNPNIFAVLFCCSFLHVFGCSFSKISGLKASS